MNLKNTKVLITAGPTREYLDPVRYLTNGSSGAMGMALAQEAARLGAKVTLVLGPVEQFKVQSLRFKGKFGTLNLKLETLNVVPVISAWDMYEAVKKHLSGTEIFIGAAAVSDYRPFEPSSQKLKRHQDVITLKLYGNPDIIAMIGHLEKKRPRLVVGFALETERVIEQAAEKLVRKKMDWIVANETSNLGSEEGAATLLSRWGDKITIGKRAKRELAKGIWKAILKKS